MRAVRRQGGARFEQTDTSDVLKSECDVAQERLSVHARGRQGGNATEVGHGNVKHGSVLRGVGIEQQPKLAKRHSREERVRARDSAARQ